MSIRLSEYGFVRVAAISPELKVADVEFNTEKIVESARIAKDKGASIILFPELSLSAYTCGDLFFQRNLLNACINSLIELKELSSELQCTLIVGLPFEHNSVLYNSAAVISNGEISGIVPKSSLCNYNEFYEERWFTSGSETSEIIELLDEDVAFGTNFIFNIPQLNDLKFGVEICEDLWSVLPPSSFLTLGGAQLIFNLSASNETLGKAEYRRELVKHQSAKTLSAYVYASSGPGESSTDLCYSGHSIISENGKILSESDRFSFNSNILIQDIDIEKLKSERLKIKTFANQTHSEFSEIQCEVFEDEVDELIYDLSKHPFIPSSSDSSEVCYEIFELQSTALAKRIDHIGIKNVVIGVSGGLDSTLALLVCVEAFKKLNLDLLGIHGIVMPGPGSSTRTQKNAKALINMLGCTLKTIKINKAVNQHLSDLEHNGDHDVTFENAQARERTQILMNYSNKVNGIVIGTGDLSELALGWCTYNADQMSMYGVNSGIPKTLVRYIIEWVEHEFYDNKGSKILDDILATPISPELIPGNDEIVQKTEDKIGPYELHDFFLYHMFRFGFSPTKIFYLAELSFKEDYNSIEILEWLKVFYKRFFVSQFKRSVMPDSVKIGSVVLSPRGDWRMPSDASFKLWIKELEEIS